MVSKASNSAIITSHHKCVHFLSIVLELESCCKNLQLVGSVEYFEEANNKVAREDDVDTIERSHLTPHTVLWVWATNVGFLTQIHRKLFNVYPNQFSHAPSIFSGMCRTYHISENLMALIFADIKCMIIVDDQNDN